MKTRSWTPPDAEKLIGCRLAAGDITSQDGPITARVDGGRPFTRTIYYSFDGVAVAESWIVHGGGHAWYGGNPAGYSRRSGRPRRVRRDDPILPPPRGDHARTLKTATARRRRDCRPGSRTARAG